ncbi:LysR family transcriptional regulator [Hellea balneolensis]|uniref:LysR family transcriptional regulator n=1 Tax=Hellea balneolensis TaxID=287478 RepID=UPI00040D99FB|nr:LysR family transcriptional regulator [Hellea balneolensis]
MDRFRRMEIFVAVVETGQITRASEKLHLSKSAVSHGLSDLERYLGVQLLSRNPRALQLTGAGQSYYDHCKRILADVETVEEGLRGDEKKVSGHIRITAPDTFGSYLLTPIFSQFMDENPDITLDLHLTERSIDLVEEGFDLAFRIKPTEDRQHKWTKLSSVRMVACASPSYLKEANKPLNDLKDLKYHNCLIYTRSPTWHFVKNGKAYEFTPEGRITTNSGENLRQFALAGQGIIYLPYFLAYYAISKKQLVTVLNDYEGRNLDGYIVRPAHLHCPARVQSLIDFTIERTDAMKGFLNSMDRAI